MSTRDQLREQLREGCSRVPVEKYQQWDYGRVLAFKEAIKQGKKVVAKAAATEAELHSAINRLASFW